MLIDDETGKPHEYVRLWHRAAPQEDPDMPLHLRVKTKGLDCLPPHKPSLFDRETWH